MIADGFVYFVQAGGVDGPIKIGFTAGRPSTRMAALQTGNHEPLQVIAVVRGTPKLEADLHQRFAAARRVGEWFDLVPELRALLLGIKLAESDAGATAEAVPENALGVTAIEFAQLVEELAEEIVSRRGMADAEALVSADPEGAAEWGEAPEDFH